MGYAKPLPQVNADTRPFWQGCRQHLLKIQKCKNCGLLRWPPAFICPACLSSEVEWVVAKGRGRVYSFAVYHSAYQPGFQDELPYVVALVDLDEGPRMITNIVGCDPGGVYCEMAVEIVWDDVSEAFSIPKFRPLQGEG
ncbi:MAG: Zn-ribbon domain-containing OB-fold protein [Desulfobacterales bacterium]|nr:Zn-ribbon domain-containing OB-fold protein [Desulfobacterales bacterium]